MAETQYKEIAKYGGIILTIILTSGMTLFIEKTGDYTNCRGEWELQENGTYHCAQKNINKFCYEIEDRGSGWYRCWEGKVVEIVKENSVNDINENHKSIGDIIKCKQKTGCEVI